MSAETVKAWAAGLGFDDCRIATAKRATHADDFVEWIADGRHGEMAWLEKTPHRRCDPREVLQGCQSVITLAINYHTGDSPFPAGHPQDYRIARYSWNEDYHDLIEKRLAALDEKLQTLGGTQRYYVDTGPVLERDFATDAGLGWNGKSTVQIHRRLGTWFFLAELLTTLHLPPDTPSADHCGKCTRCITACPTQAITAPHRLDARRCISYLTIEHKGPIPMEFRRAIGDRIYGCDDCLAACPWNRFAQQSREITFQARPEIFAHTLRDFLSMDEEAFRRTFAKSPVKRIKRPPASSATSASPSETPAAPPTSPPSISPPPIPIRSSPNTQHGRLRRSKGGCDGGLKSGKDPSSAHGQALWYQVRLCIEPRKVVYGEGGQLGL